MSRSCALVLSVAFMLAVLAVGADPTQAQSKCTSAKWKTAAKLVSSDAKCASKAVKKGDAVDPACQAKADGKFASRFAKAEAKDDCLTAGDAALAQGLVDAFLADLDALLEPPLAFCCAAVTQCLMADTEVDCTMMGGAVAGPGTVCDGSGSCVLPPGAGGNCCQDVPAPAAFSCIAGSTVDEALCTGTFVPDAVCVQGGVCIPR